MINNFINNLIEKYNLKDYQKLFADILDDYFAGKFPDEDLAYHLQTPLNLSLSRSLDLAMDIIEMPKEQKNKLNEIIQEEEKNNIDLEEMVNEFVRLGNLKFDDVLKKRVEKIFISYVQDVRNDLSVLETMQRGDKLGGLGLNEEKAKALLAAFKAQKQKLIAEGKDIKTLGEEKSLTEFIDENIDVKAKLPEIDSQAKPKSDFVAPGTVTIKDLLREKTNVPLPETEPQPAKSFAQTIKEEEKMLEREEEIKAPATPVVPQPPPKTSRPKMDDVVFTPKLYGPIEELGSMNLINFRRLSSDPVIAVRKIIDKLNLLAEESMDKKVLAIQSLKKSPLYKIYSDIITRSFSQGKPVSAVITPEDGLTIDEFKAIMELNKMLKN